MLNFWTGFKIIYILKIISANSEISNFTGELYKLVNEISAEYFQVFNCVTYVADDPDNEKYLEKQLPIFIINLVIQEHESLHERLLTESFEQGCGGYIIQTEAKNRSTMVRNLIEAKKRAVGYRDAKQRYLFLPASKNDTDLSVLQEPDMFFIPNYLFVCPNNDSNDISFLLVGHTIFDSYKHDVIEIGHEIIDAWSPRSGFKHRNDLYPDRIKNVRGKKLIFGLMNYVPYSVILQKGDVTTYDGLETRIAAQFVHSINGTWDGLDHPIEMWGTKLPNGTGTGILGSVQKHVADLGYSAIYQWYCDILDCSYPYIQPEVICLVPKPQIVSGWLTILLPFTLATWIGVFIFFLITCVVVFCLSLSQQRLEGKKVWGSVTSIAFQSFYIICRLHLQQIPREVLGNSALSTFIKISTLYYFVVAVFWEGGIASILTIPRYDEPINTAFDLVSRWPKVKWGAIHDVWIHSIENSTEPVLYQIVKKFVILDNDTLVKKTKTRDFGFFIEKLPHGHYGFNDYINEETIPYLQLMDNSIYTAFGVIILPKGSPYTEKLNHMVHWMFATGIVEKMEIQVSLERIDNHLQNMIKYSKEKQTGQVMLSLSHIRGPVCIYLAGVSISILTLFIEKVLFSYKVKAKGQSLRNTFKRTLAWNSIKLL